MIERLEINFAGIKRLTRQNKVRFNSKEKTSPFKESLLCWRGHRQGWELPSWESLKPSQGLAKSFRADRSVILDFIPLALLEA